MGKYKADVLKLTDSMKRILAREKEQKDKGVHLPGEPVVFSDFFIDAMKSVPGIEINKFDFYMFAYRPEQIDQMPGINLEFDYKGTARELNEIPMWHEIQPKISILECGDYTLIYNGANFIPNETGSWVRIRYRIRKNQIEPTMAPIGMKPKPETIFFKEQKEKVKREVKNA